MSKRTKETFAWDVALFVIIAIVGLSYVVRIL